MPLGNPPAHPPGEPAAHAGHLLRWWPLLPAAWMMAGLLFSLTDVVRQSVEQAQARHAHTAARAAAHFRCNTLADPQARSDCRADARDKLPQTIAAHP